MVMILPLIIALIMLLVVLLLLLQFLLSSFSLGVSGPGEDEPVKALFQRTHSVKALADTGVSSFLN